MIDESHNVTNSATQNNRLARVLSPNTDALILASATPHNCASESFAELVRCSSPRLSPHGRTHHRRGDSARWYDATATAQAVGSDGQNRMTKRAGSLLPPRLPHASRTLAPALLRGPGSREAPRPQFFSPPPPPPPGERASVRWIEVARARKPRHEQQPSSRRSSARSSSSQADRRTTWRRPASCASRPGVRDARSCRPHPAVVDGRRAQVERSVNLGQARHLCHASPLTCCHTRSWPPDGPGT